MQLEWSLEAARVLASLSTEYLYQVPHGGQHDVTQGEESKGFQFLVFIFSSSILQINLLCVILRPAKHL